MKNPDEPSSSSQQPPTLSSVSPQTDELLNEIDFAQYPEAHDILLEAGNAAVSITPINPQAPPALSAAGGPATSIGAPAPPSSSTAANTWPVLVTPADRRQPPDSAGRTHIPPITLPPYPYSQDPPSYSSASDTWLSSSTSVASRQQISTPRHGRTQFHSAPQRASYRVPPPPYSTATAIPTVLTHPLYPNFQDPVPPPTYSTATAIPTVLTHPLCPNFQDPVPPPTYSTVPAVGLGSITAAGAHRPSAPQTTWAPSTFNIPAPPLTGGAQASTFSGVGRGETDRLRREFLHRHRFSLAPPPKRQRHEGPEYTRPPPANDKGKKVYVHGVSLGAELGHLHEHFGVFGQIDGMQLVKRMHQPNQVGLVVFAEAESARQALAQSAGMLMNVPVEYHSAYLNCVLCRRGDF